MATKKVVKKASKKGVKKGDAYKCSVCGILVSVDAICGCVDTCARATPTTTRHGPVFPPKRICFPMGS